MATGLKRFFPDFTFSGNKVTPDEIDRYETYTVVNPSIDSQWFGTMTAAGTSTVRAWSLINDEADYPRNLRFSLAGSAVGMAGTSVVNGLNQFGSAVTETLAFGSADNGGTVVGTQVYAKVTSGTVTFGTAVGSGTPRLGVGTAGTTTIFGLPTKIGGTTDIKRLNGSFTGVGTQTSGTFVFGGTPSSAGIVSQHGFRAPADVQAGTVLYNITYKPTYDASNDVANLANL